MSIIIIMRIVIGRVRIIIEKLSMISKNLFPILFQFSIGVERISMTGVLFISEREVFVFVTSKLLVIYLYLTP